MAVAGVAGVAGCTTGKSHDAPAPSRGGLARRVLGRTGEKVTILGLGCAYAAGKTDEAQTRATIEAALEGGVRYFDMAPNYGDCEKRLGPLLSPMRDEIFLVTKVDSPTAQGAEANLTNSLKLLKTDHVDLLLQHGVGLPGSWSDTGAILGKGGSLEFLRRAKAKGLARFIGLSIHPPFDKALMLLDAADDWDVVMPFVNYVARVEFDAETVIVGRAQRHGLGVTAMKVLGGNGQLADAYDRAFRYALSVPGVSCALIGAKNVEEVQRAVRAAREYRPLTTAELEDTIRLGRELVRAKSAKVALLHRHVACDFGAETNLAIT
jgi:aryl-alcohol dehydrogenase-like predicted oxidoreductase